MLLGNFARKAYDRYTRSKAQKGNYGAKEELWIKQRYLDKQGLAISPLDREAAGSGMGVYGEDYSKQSVLRGGAYTPGGFTKLKEDPLITKAKNRKAEVEINRSIKDFNNRIDELNQVSRSKASVIDMDDFMSNAVKKVTVEPNATTAATKVSKTVGIGKKGKLALGVGLLGTAAIGGLIAVKATQRRTKKGKTVTVKGYSRNRRRRK